MTDRNEIAGNTRAYIKHLELMGEENLPKPAVAAKKIPAMSAARADSAEKAALLKALQDEVLPCVKCDALLKNRSHVVFGAGNPDARLVFIGEAPGAEEDKQGLPFVGDAGQLLTKMIDAMGLSREQVYICNVLKCRPPLNRNPLPGEIQNCEPYLKRQLAIIKPQIICTLGKFSAQLLLKTEATISSLRGNFHEYEGIKLMPTYHPAYLLRNPAEKKKVWADLQQIMDFLGLKK